MNLTLNSIFGQFDFWKKAQMPSKLTNCDAVYVVVGCGTSYNLALSVAATLSSAGLVAIGVPAGEWIIRPEAYLPKKHQKCRGDCLVTQW